MWKTVGMRIRGAKLELEEAGEDTEGMVTSTAELRDLIKSLTGFDIMQDENTFKDLKDIIVGIGKEWENLNDLEQNGLLEKLAGKQQSNALAAALNNWKTIEEIYNTSIGAEGSALKENEAYMKSIQGHLDQLKNSWIQFWNSDLARENINPFIDFAKGIIDVINKLGLLKTSLIAISTITAGIFAIRKGGGRARIKTICKYKKVNYSHQFN